MGLPFTWAAYRRLIESALASGYEFVGFDRVADETLPERALLLRHDIDYDLVPAVRMAELESEAGVMATYFLQSDSPLYELDDTLVSKILSLGHALGFHIDANPMRDDEEIASQTADGAQQLAQRFGAPVHAASFHMPGRRPVGHITPPGLVNTYAPVFFEQFGYISDSNQNWRESDPLRSVSEVEHPRLQLLIHPLWWGEREEPMVQKLEAVAARNGLALDDVITVEQRALLG